MSTERDRIIRAAGGVVWRAAGDDVEIAVVHRPKYDDWSLPKGKLDAGESWEEAAVREVWEETGLRADPGAFVGHVEYVTRGSDGRRGKGSQRKVVRYWAMRTQGHAEDEPFIPNREVDALRWLRPRDAVELLTHQLDRTVVGRFLDIR